MRTCPVCGANGVSAQALFAAAVKSSGRCSKCGSGLRFTWASDILIVSGFVAAPWVGFASGSVWWAAIASVATWSAVLALPLKPDDADPITFRKQLKERRQKDR